MPTPRTCATLCLLWQMFLWGCASATGGVDLQIARWPQAPADLSPALLQAGIAPDSLQPPEVSSSTLRGEHGQRGVWQVQVNAVHRDPAEPPLLALRQLGAREAILYAPPDYRPLRAHGFDPDRSRLYSDTALVFTLPAQLQPGDRLYVELPAAPQIAVELVLADRESFVVADRSRVRFHTAMITAILACVGVALCFWLVLRERVWLLYLGFVGCNLVFMVIRSGEYIALPGAHWLTPHLGTAGIVSGMAAAAFSIRFHLVFADLRRHAPRLARAAAWASTGMATLALLALLPLPALVPVVVTIGNLSLLLAIGLLAVGTLLAILKRSRQAAFFALAWLPAVSMTALLVAPAMGWSAQVGPIQSAYIAANVWMTLLLTLGMADQVLAYRHQRDTALSLAERDPLTGALNRRAVQDALRSALATLQHGRSSVALMYLDLDHFKQVNDQHGHRLGDRALRLLVEITQRELRGSDLLGRFGGEEFVVVLPGAYLRDALQLAERVRRGLETAGKVIDGIAVHLTVSIGVVASTPKLNQVEALIEAADRALYRAKHDGRNRVTTLDLITLKDLPEDVAA